MYVIVAFCCCGIDGDEGLYADTMAVDTTLVPSGFHADKVEVEEDDGGDEDGGDFEDSYEHVVERGKPPIEGGHSKRSGRKGKTFKQKK